MLEQILEIQCNVVPDAEYVFFPPRLDVDFRKFLRINTHLTVTTASSGLGISLQEGRLKGPELFCPLSALELETTLGFEFVHGGAGEELRLFTLGVTTSI